MKRRSIIIIDIDRRSRKFLAVEGSLDRRHTTQLHVQRVSPYDSRTGATPIVGIDLRPIEGLFAFQAVVILDITTEQVTAHDPLHQEGYRSIGLSTFEIAWNKADRETVIILPEPKNLAI